MHQPQVESVRSAYLDMAKRRRAFFNISIFLLKHRDRWNLRA
jgi:hypothetical protein